MNDKHFDKILKAKLDDVKFSFDESKWSSLVKTLDSIDQNVTSDQIISKKLSNHTVPYKESHWQILKNKLEQEKALKANIYWTNLAEVVIIALLLLSFHQFNKHYAKQPQKIDLIASVQIQEKQQENNQKELLNKPEISPVRNNIALKQIVANNSIRDEATDATVTGSPLNKIVDSKTSIARQPFINAVASIEPIKMSVQSNVNTKPSILSNLVSNLSRENIIISAIDVLDSKNDIAFGNASTSAIPQMIEETRTKKWIGLMAGIDFNTIKTPIDFGLVKSPRNFLAMGLSQGINYGVQKGKNEILVSTNYSVKVYDPKIVEAFEVDKSYYDRRHRQEKFSIIQIPTVYRRHLSSANNLSTYAFVGIGVNVVTETEYITLDHLKRGDPRPKYARDQAAKYAQYEFHEGLLEGGHFKYNIFMTAEAGLGIQKEFNRMAVFMDTNYKRNLFEGKLGPRDVKLNSLSFNIGTRYRL